MSMAEIAPIRPLDEAAALDWLRAQPGGRTKLSAAELGRRWGWHRQRAGRRIKAWQKSGLVTRRGTTVAAVVDSAPAAAPKANTRPVRVPPQVTPAVTLSVTPAVTGLGLDTAAYLAAVGLAAVAAWFSIRGMGVLFPGAPLSVIAMAFAMETAKLVTAGWLARRWRVTAWIWRLTLIALIAGVAVINAGGVYAQLVAAHVGERGAAQSAIETQSAALAARIDVQAHTVADLDRRLGQIDSAIEEAAKHGRSNAALSAIDGQRKARAELAGQRQREGVALADLKAERAAIGAKGRQMETESAPIRYVAELVGADADSERAIRWLIALMVMCCDPLAIALTAAAAARRNEV
jgi:hypothetical protein